MIFRCLRDELNSQNKELSDLREDINLILSKTKTNLT
jgi:hypothetical protein